MQQTALVRSAVASEVFGSVSAELRFFADNGFYPAQKSLNISLSGEFEYTTSWSNGQQHLVFKPFFRIDQNDPERSHVDVRELLWVYSKDNFTVQAGFGKVFWGAAEFTHLVDIINQTDTVESLDGEDKLGQPMISLSTLSAVGEFEIFLLPGFRERTFPGSDGRLRIAERIDVDRPVFESRHADDHFDWALRWSHSIANLDIGLSFFKGTNRTPSFIVDPVRLPDIVLRPLYEQIEQISIDAQTTIGNWLWKFEYLYQSSSGQHFFASTGGFEYSFVGVFDTRSDLGLVVEYMYDERGLNANHFQQDDLGLGLRLAMNDTQSTEVLLGLIRDQELSSEVWNLEMSRRLGDNWKLSVEGYAFKNIADQDVLAGFQQDDFVSFQVSRFF